MVVALATAESANTDASKKRQSVLLKRAGG